MIVYLVFALASAIIGPVDVPSHLPDRLRQVMESPKANTSQIEWTITYLDGVDAGLVEQHITRTVGDTIWQVNLGDEKGYHWTSYLRSPRSDSEEDRREAEVPREDLAGPWHSLLYEGVAWNLEHQKRRIPLGGWAAPENEAGFRRPFDFSAPGLRVSWLQMPQNVLGLRDRFLEGFDGAKWSVASRGNIETITGEFQDKVLEWDLDKTRGGQPIRAAFYVDNELRYTSYTKVTEIDGQWVPSSIRFYHGEDEQPYKVIEVQKASFDKPDHVQEITPEDIGVLFGSQLYCAEGLCSWDGTGLINYIDEFYELLFIYGLRPGPIITERQASLEHKTVEELLADWDKTMEQWRGRYLKEHGEDPWLVKKSEAPDEWDLYVAKFIKKHEFDEPRIKRANELLGRAKKLRDYHKRKNRSETRKAKEAGDTEKVARYEAVTERIFKRVLVRGLNKLIPREQRRAG